MAASTQCSVVEDFLTNPYQPCCAQLTRLRTQSFTCAGPRAPARGLQEGGRRRLQELVTGPDRLQEGRRRLQELVASGGDRAQELVTGPDRVQEGRRRLQEMEGREEGAWEGRGREERAGEGRGRSASVSAGQASPRGPGPVAARTSSFSPGSLAPARLPGAAREKPRIGAFSFRSRASSVSSASSTPSSASSSPYSSDSSAPSPPCSTEQFWNQYRRRPPTISMTKMLRKALTSRLPSRERRAPSSESQPGGRARAGRSVERGVCYAAMLDSAAGVQGRGGLEPGVRGRLEPGARGRLEPGARGRRLRADGAYPPSGLGLL